MLTKEPRFVLYLGFRVHAYLWMNLCSENKFSIIYDKPTYGNNYCTCVVQKPKSVIKIWVFPIYIWDILKIKQSHLLSITLWYIFNEFIFYHFVTSTLKCFLFTSKQNFRLWIWRDVIMKYCEINTYWTHILASSDKHSLYQNNLRQVLLMPTY